MSTNFILTDEQSSNLGDQLSFDFQSVVEKNEKEKNTVKLTIPHSDPQKIKIPYLNTPDNFLKNFTEISTAFESDTVEAARYLLRVMTKPSRDLTLSNMQKAGCSDRESYHRYLMDYLQKERETPRKIEGIDDKKVAEIVNEFRAGKIDENTAKVRLRTEANYPEWVGADQLLQTKAYLEWQSKLERYNKRKYDFIGTLPEGFRKAREWFVYEKFIFNGESKSISNYINEQMDAGTLVVTGNGVNGYNLGKYGYLFAQYLINSLKKELNEEWEKTEAWLDENSPDHEQSSDIGLNSLQQEIEQQRKERNSVLSTVSKGVLTDLEKITDIKELRNWLGSAENALRIAKEAGLKEIKRQYDDGGSVSIGDNILKRDDILDRVSPQDIKQILIYNAQHIVDSINNKINSLSYPTELIQTEQDNFELSNNEYEEIDWKRVKELEIEGKSKRNDKALVNYLERRGVPKELVKQAFLWAFSSTAAPDDFTEGLKKYIEKSGHL